MIINSYPIYMYMRKKGYLYDIFVIYIDISNQSLTFLR